MDCLIKFVFIETEKSAIPVQASSYANSGQRRVLFN